MGGRRRRQEGKKKTHTHKPKKSRVASSRVEWKGPVPSYHTSQFSVLNPRYSVPQSSSPPVAFPFRIPILIAQSSHFSIRSWIRWTHSWLDRWIGGSRRNVISSRTSFHPGAFRSEGIKWLSGSVMPLRSVSKIMRISYFRGHVLLVSVWSVSCVYVISRLYRALWHSSSTVCPVPCCPLRFSFSFDFFIWYRYYY